MPEQDDHQLLAEFVREDSESAFSELVRRYIALVYSTAYRFSSNPHHAEEITQAVFIILARKAGTLSSRVVLSGWLYQAARLTAANFIKGEIRRARREQEVYMQSTLPNPETTDWDKIAPLLDEAMGKLGETDRTALVLRFFENRTSAEIGSALRMDEDTARRRVNRALEKLRKIFNSHGVNSAAETIAGAISANSIQAVPAAVAKSVTAAAVAKGATASISTLTLIKGALKIMVWSKTQTTIVAGIILLLAATATTVVIKQNDARNSWDIWPMDPSAFFATLKRTPPQVRIYPTKFPSRGNFQGGSGGKMMGFGASISNMAQEAYANPSERSWDNVRTVVSLDVPQGRYDYIANLPNGSSLALQNYMEKKLGVVGKRETRNEDVLLLALKNPNMPGLKLVRPDGGRNSKTLPDGEESFLNYKTSNLADEIERTLNIPVVDGTGLPGNYDFTMRWDQDADHLKQSLLDQLGLVLVPTNMPVQMLIVGKVK
jgi:uncharacterized protein (TIGR03435 family)